MPSKVWSEITYPFPNFNGCTVEVWEWDKQFRPILDNGCNYSSMLGFQLIHVSKMCPRWLCRFPDCTKNKIHRKRVRKNWRAHHITYAYLQGESYIRMFVAWFINNLGLKGELNPSGAEAGTFRDNWVNIMPVDVLTPYVVSSSAAMIVDII